MSNLNSDEEQVEALLTQGLMEYVFDVNGPGERMVVTHDQHGETVDVYDVDQSVVPDNGAAAILVRRSDGARFEVFVSAAVNKL